MWRSVRIMAGDGAVRRVRQVLGTLSTRARPRLVVLRLCSSQAEGTQVVRIGDVSITVQRANNPEFIPTKYLNGEIPQSLLRHLRWIMQKDNLGQDIFLIGPPGPLRRTLAMMYLEMTGREVEYVSLSRDTTESDLKQRREIQKGTAYHIDQCAVEAATRGRVLILEGIEKAERNVLPVLNNLLENREMQLNDGRFLMAAPRYDKLLQIHSQAEMDAWKLVRVSENFRVMALGLPVPRYQGNPLDPPLRSRFQARDINPLPFKDQLEFLNIVSGGLSTDKLSKMVSFASTLNSSEGNKIGLPDFPIENLSAIIQILRACPSASCERLLERLYPSVMLGKEGRTAVTDALQTFELKESSTKGKHRITTVQRGPEGATVQMDFEGQPTQIKVACGNADRPDVTSEFVATPYHEGVLADMMTSHMVHDFCIVGPRGSGKSILVNQFAKLLGYHVEPIMLYQDMTSRDLLQQRTTLPSGDTAWRPSPLVTAALEGSLAVLDGVHRVNAGTFAVLHRLVHDRELTLFDGTRLLRHDRYDVIKQRDGLSDEEMANKGILRIMPTFRMVALAEPPVVGSSAQQWLNSELLTMFLYHHLRPLSLTEENDVLHQLVPNMKQMDQIMKLTHKLRNSGDSNLKSLAASLSTRQLVRMARRLATYPDEPLYETLEKACLSRFLPRITRTALEEEMAALGLQRAAPSATPAHLDTAITCEIQDGVLRIGNTTAPVFNPETKIKVPDVLFYENPQHLSMMEGMLKDYLLGEHLLLVGNQGVGKNKIIDRFLHLLNRPREYLQLHRDTTVQTLTLQPTVQDGIIVYEDSPLVRAVKLGQILVVDEADKAPTNVTCILKTLIESGEMHLADGRRIVSAHSGMAASKSIIVAHPEFRMFILANRPGFPFLGNDFFGAMGDIFSCHAVDNPDPESEMSMLRRYGPDVPDSILRKLVLAFGDLRNMADQGLITYPYSTREVVNMVKHLQTYPDEGLANVVKNVFDFDMYNTDMVETLVTTLQKHGIPIGAHPANIRLGKEMDLPKLTLAGKVEIRRLLDVHSVHSPTCPTKDLQLRIKGPVTLEVTSFPLDRNEARSLLFSEQEAFWTLPLHETSVISDVGVTLAANRQKVAGLVQGDLLHVVTSNPASLYTMDPNAQTLTAIDLFDIFRSQPSGMSRNRFHVAPLGAPLDATIVLHEEFTNTVLDINVETGAVRRLETNSVIGAVADKMFTFNKSTGMHRMCSDLSQDPAALLLFYKEGHQSIDIIMMLEGRGRTIQLPIKIKNLHTLSKTDWIVTEAGTESQYLMTSTTAAPFDFTLQRLEPDASGVCALPVLEASGEVLSDSLLSQALGEKISSPNRVLATKDTYTAIAIGLPELTSVDVYTAPRAARFGKGGHVITNPRSRDPIVVLPQSGQVVRIVPTNTLPDGVIQPGVKISHLAGFLEVSDAVNHKLRYISIPGVITNSYAHLWFNAGSDVNVVMAAMSDDGLVTVDSGGCIRLWETSTANLDRSIQQWRQLIGHPDEHLQMTFERKLPAAAPDAPKHGKVDETGAPHVGGNTWAGGTGGRDTAGLGGVGGPYRLDGGHDVHQVSQEQKDAVPDHIKMAAREMGLKAWRARLKEIKMSEYDGEMYERFAKNVARQVSSLRIMLENLQAKGKEREWLNHQTQGELDDNKLIEGITGEKAIYRRRGEKEPEVGAPQQSPKHLKLLVDVSGSMYRFDGHDGRLQREMEATIMVMEALENHQHKIKYDIIGHSGEGHNFDFVRAQKPPKNNRERLDVIKTLHAHSQFCMSGDHTLDATKAAITTIALEKADEHFVIVLSDANLDRYGIRPQRFANLLTSDENVNAYVIFIGSLGNQATSLVKEMPAGRAFVCMDTANLPQILQQIFTSTMLNTR